MFQDCNELNHYEYRPNIISYCQSKTGFAVCYSHQLNLGNEYCSLLFPETNQSTVKILPIGWIVKGSKQIQLEHFFTSVVKLQRILQLRATHLVTISIVGGKKGLTIHRLTWLSHHM